MTQPLEGAVIGVGVDLVHVPSFAAQLDQPGTRFASATFTAGERRDVAARGGDEAKQAQHWAARWAAREAFVKAWSASLYGDPPVMGDEVLRLVEVVCDAWGRPRLVLHGEVADRLVGVRTHLSLSHDGDHAIAYVILEA